MTDRELNHPLFAPLQCACVDDDPLTCARVRFAAPDDGGQADDDAPCQCPCHWQTEEHDES